jgi:hypothetical protein
MALESGLCLSLIDMGECDYYEPNEPASVALGTVAITTTGERLLLRQP